MSKLLLFLAMAFASIPGAGLSQSVVKNAIVVNGLQVGEKYTREQFVQALGTPTKIEPPQETDAYENAYTFYYGKDRFYWIDGQFHGFDLRTPAFFVNGLLRVGESTRKIDSLGGVKEYGKTPGVLYWRPTKNGLYQWLSLDCYYNADNVMTSILCFIQDL